MKKRRGPRRGRVIPALFAFFVVGVVTGWFIRGVGGQDARSKAGGTAMPPVAVLEREPMATPPMAPAAETGVSTTGVEDPPRASSTAPIRPTDSARPVGLDVVSDLRRRHLLLPIEGARIERMRGQFAEARDRSRTHEAVDILAPRGTPILAVEDGTIARLFQSKAGGTTVYQFEPSGRFCYYYAHLERYASHLKEGLPIKAGDTIGYVGTSGNAPPNTPHLHFAVFELTPERQWWTGRAIDPYLVFSPAS